MRTEEASGWNIFKERSKIKVHLLQYEGWYDEHTKSKAPSALHGLIMLPPHTQLSPPCPCVFSLFLWSFFFLFSIHRRGSGIIQHHVRPTGRDHLTRWIHSCNAGCTSSHWTEGKFVQGGPRKPLYVTCWSMTAPLLSGSQTRRRLRLIGRLPFGVSGDSDSRERSPEAEVSSQTGHRRTHRSFLSHRAWKVKPFVCFSFICSGPLRK